MKPLCVAANTAWLLSALPSALAFRRNFHRADAVQSEILFTILRRNATTDFGKRHGFASISTLREYLDQVPIRRYEELAADLQRIEAGEQNVLTTTPVDHLEPTSGSSGKAKLIPHTSELRAELGRAFAPWVHASFANEPRAFAGPAYWSLSPAGAAPQRSSGGARIGFDGDEDYLGPLRSRIVRATHAVPSSVRSISDLDTFRRVTMLHLLRQRSLSMISIWHPSFLMLLVGTIQTDGPALADEIAIADRARATEVRNALYRARTPADLHAALWPALRTISCWTDAASAAPSRELARLFPQATIEPKGLLSTEGVVSIPLHGSDAPALAYRSHFYELRDVAAGTVVPAFEAEVGRRYDVILTTGGGLYRYATEDQVDVVGFHGTCPLLRFVGRADHVADHFGEKLNEVFVRERLERVLREHDLSLTFAWLACEQNGASNGRYTLFIHCEESDDDIRTVTKDLEPLLRESFHYDHCRRMGQLEPLAAYRVEADPLAVIARVTGQQLGQIKPAALDRRLNWSREFEGSLID